MDCPFSRTVNFLTISESASFGNGSKIVSHDSHGGGGFHDLNLDL